MAAAGGMFGEEGKTNFERFASNAKKMYLLYSLAGLLVLSVILSPLLLLLPFTIPLTLWYANESMKRFLFTLDKGYFFARRGVFFYNYNLIPYENIQDIHVAQDFFAQLFGVWSVIVFTATVGGGAVVIPWLGKDEAERLKTELFKRMKEARDVTD